MLGRGENILPTFRQKDCRDGSHWVKIPQCTSTIAGLFFGHLKKNSRCKKLKTQEKNSKLKLKIQISGTFEEKQIFVH